MISVLGKISDSKSVQLSERLKVPLVASCAEAGELCLEYREGILCLFFCESPRSSVQVDFWQHYQTLKKTNGLGRSTLLGKAAGAKADENRTLVDATLGLGKDAFVFAFLGFEVRAFERSPVIYELALDGYHRALLAEGDKAFLLAMKRIELHFGPSEEFLSSAAVCDVVYLDPMYPEKKKRALPKKEMQLLQVVADSTANLDELVGRARRAARSRVVVKRPPQASKLEDTTMSFDSKSVRYDCFVNNNC